MNIPEGYRLVPVEPTRTQLVAGLGTNGIHPIYCAMVSAAPHLDLAPSDLLEAIENLLWHAEQLEELIESERGKGRSSDQLYAAGEMHAYMVDAKSCIEKLKAETSEVGISLEEVLANAYECGYGDGQNSPNGYSCEDDRNKCVAEQLELLEGIDACAESKSSARSAE